MGIKLNEAQEKLLKDPNFGFVGTLMPDGSPQVTPVWIDYDGKHVIFNTEEKRAKPRNMKKDPRISICVPNMQNPYEYIEIRGRVVEMTTDGASEHIDAMAKKYLGQDKYPYNKPDDVRVIVKVEPEKVVSQ